MSEMKEIKEQVKDLKVLFVEDDKTINQSTVDFLKKFFTHIDSCYDGVEGLQLYKEKQDYQVVITDVLMPIMNGDIMAQKIKELNSNTIIVFLTASREEVNTDFCDMYFKKPIDYKSMKTMLNNIIQIKSD